MRERAPSDLISMMETKNMNITNQDIPVRLNSFEVEYVKDTSVNILNGNLDIYTSNKKCKIMALSSNETK